MAHKLDGAVAKLNRAREQTHGLNEAIRETFESNPYRVMVAEREHRPDHYSLRLEPGQVIAPPSDWSPIIGEIAHDLRSSLDLLACELALLKCRSVDIRSVYFPIVLYGRKANRGGRWKRRWNGNRVALFKRQHGARIKRLQPYHRRNGQRRNFLWLLEELNNADKHRAIQTITVSARGISPRRLEMGGGPGESPRITGFEFKQGVPLKDCAKVGSIEAFIPRSTTVKMDARVAAKVVFDNACGAVRGLEVIRVLVGAANVVHETLRLFARDLRTE